MPDPTSLLEIGARLAVTRKALGLTQAEMDRRMGSALTNGQTFTFTRSAANGFQLTTHSRYAGPATSRLIGFTAGRCLQPDICAKIETELDALVEGEDRTFCVEHPTGARTEQPWRVRSLTQPYLR